MASITTQSTDTTSSSSTLSRSSEAINESAVTVTKTITDDGAGGFLNSMGTVAYAASTIALKVVDDYSTESWNSNYEDANDFESLNATSRSGITNGAADSGTGGGGADSAKGGEYSSVSVKDVFAANSLFVSYTPAGSTPTAGSVSAPMQPVVIDLLPTTRESIVPGSLQFTWMGNTYFDQDGIVYTGTTPAGTVNYAAGTISMDQYIAGSNPSSVTIQLLWTQRQAPSVASIVFQVQTAPVKPGGLIFSCTDIAGTQLIGTAGIDGMITGDHMRGVMDNETGLVEMLFGDYVEDSTLTAADKAEWWYDPAEVQGDGMIWRPWSVDPGSLRYNAVSYTYLPLDADLLGLDPVRLPSDGRVPIFRAGSFGVIGHTGIVGPITVSNGQTVDCGRVRLSRVRVLDANSAVINTGYSTNLEAGTVTFSDVTGYAQPVSIEHRIEDMAMIRDVQINGDVTFTRQITHDYPAGSVLSSALVMGDVRARVTAMFDQQTWANAWADVASGAAASASFNDAAYPITVTNAGTLTERWAIVFTNTTSFQVIGENIGVIATGNTSTDCAPVNPATGKPYFTIPALGWGLGWAAGNALRFNTSGAFFPVWVVRTIQQGQETITDDSFSLLIRGDIDRP